MTCQRSGQSGIPETDGSSSSSSSPPWDRAFSGPSQMGTCDQYSPVHGTCIGAIAGLSKALHAIPGMAIGCPPRDPAPPRSATPVAGPFDGERRGPGCGTRCAPARRAAGITSRIGLIVRWNRRSSSCSDPDPQAARDQSRGSGAGGGRRGLASIDGAREAGGPAAGRRWRGRDHPAWAVGRSQLLRGPDSLAEGRFAATVLTLSVAIRG